MVRLLAFLVCERATVGKSGKVTLHELFDGMIISQASTIPRMSFGVRRGRPIFYVYYKIVADKACTVALKVLDPSGGEIPGAWSDPIAPPGPAESTWQAIWALSTSLFEVPGNYMLRLICHESGIPSPALLASTQLTVAQAE